MATLEENRVYAVTWRCEDRIKPLLDVLLKYKRMITGSDNFRPHNVTEWVSGARQTAACLDSYGVAESRWLDWMEYALRTHNNNMRESGKNPFVKSTRTLEYLVEPFATDATQNRDRYLVGVDEED